MSLKLKCQRNLCQFFDSNWNPFRMLSGVKLYVFPSSMQATVKSVVCKTLSASAITGADFCDQYIMGIQPKQKLVEPDCVYSIPIVQKPYERTREELPLPDGLSYPEENPIKSPLVRIDENFILLAHSQMCVTVQIAWAGTNALQPYTQLYDGKPTVGGNGVIFINLNVPLQILVADIGNVV